MAYAKSSPARWAQAISRVSRWMLTVVLVASFVSSGCESSTPDSKGEGIPNPPVGVKGTFVGSCRTTLGCCAQCFEYYSTAPKQAQIDALKNGCEDWDKPCPTISALGKCVLPEGSPVEGLTTVDIRYEKTTGGTVYATEGQAAQVCELQGGTWYSTNGGHVDEPGGAGGEAGSLDEGAGGLSGIGGIRGSHYMCETDAFTNCIERTFDKDLDFSSASAQCDGTFSLTGSCAQPDVGCRCVQSRYSEGYEANVVFTQYFDFSRSPNIPVETQRASANQVCNVPSSFECWGL